jgi:hypothetical protein
MRLFPQGYILFASVIFCSCSNNKEEKVYQILNDGLTASYKLISQQNQLALSRLENKTWEAATAGRGKIWYPKALAIKQRTDELINSIEKMKGQPVKLILLDSLEVYKQYILNIDTLIKEEFHNKIIFTDSGKYYDHEILNGNSSSAILSYFQNSVVMSANKLISFCDEQVVDNSFYFTTFSAIVGQNSKYVKPGDEVEIIAGVGSFSRRTNPIVRVGGEDVPLNEEATPQYKFLAPNQTGKHQIPVVIDYSDQDGKRQIINKTIEYTVMK